MGRGPVGHKVGGPRFDLRRARYLFFPSSPRGDVTEGRTVDTRPIPEGLLWSASRPGAPAEPWSETDRWFDRMVEAVADANFQGVHVGTDAAAPARGKLLAERAGMAARRPRQLVIVGPSIAEALHDRVATADARAPSGERSAAPSPSRDALCVFLEIPRSQGTDAGPLPRPEFFDQLALQHGFVSWGFGYPDVPSKERVEEDASCGPAWLRFPFGPIAPPSADDAIEVARRAGIPVVASDPFARGRLDGSRLRGSPLDTSARPAPADWAEVRGTWAPVLALGFLTERRERTLPQAALQYVLGTPGVLAVLVPAADPAALLESSAALTRIGLSRDERARIDGLRRRGEASPRTSRNSKLK